MSHCLGHHERAKKTENKYLKYLKEHHNTALAICFFGIVFFYSYFAYLQELL